MSIITRGMTVFMLKKKTGGFYSASHGGHGWGWVDQSYATVWSRRQGVSGAIGNVRRWAKRRKQEPPEMEIIEFELTQTQVTPVK